MTSLPPWAADPGSLALTEAQYDALSDRVRKLIEVIDGNITFCPGGTPEHRDVTRTPAKQTVARLVTRSAELPAAVQAARRWTSQTVTAASSPDSASSQPPSIHCNGQKWLIGW